MFVCPEFGQQVCQGRPGTRRQEVRGLINSITPSDEQQDGMRPDGLAWVSCCYYSLQRCLGCCVPRNPRLPLVAAAAACCVCLLPPTPPLLLRHRRRPPMHSLNFHATRPHFQASWHSSPAGHSAQPAHRLTSWSRLAGTSPVTRCRLACCRKRRATLACRGLEAATSRPVKFDRDRMTDEAAITPASANTNSVTA